MSIDLEAIRARNEYRKLKPVNCGQDGCEDGYHMVPDSHSLPCPNQALPPQGYVAAASDIDTLLAEVERQAKEINVDDELLAEHQRLLDVLPCEAHGSCVPHAINEVARLRSEVERLNSRRWAYFHIEQYYPVGGLNDCKSRHATEAEALAAMGDDDAGVVVDLFAEP